MQFRFTDDGDIVLGTSADESCYNLRDAAKYVQDHFVGKADISNDEVWAYLGEHPVFPTRDYKNKIKDVLKREFKTKTSVSSMTFTENRSF